MDSSIENTNKCQLSYKSHGIIFYNFKNTFIMEFLKYFSSILNRID